MEFRHIPVMYREVIEGLKIRPDGIYVDGTLGGAGHSEGILNRLGAQGRLIACDLDLSAIENAKVRLAEYQDKTTYLHDDYKNLIAHLDRLNIPSISGALFDLGVSSPQIDTPERGFSYMKDAPLDMRMDVTQRLTAYDVVNGYEGAELIRIFREYGEERLAPKIAAAIVRERAKAPIGTTLQLASLIERAYPKGKQTGHPAKRVFQAIRIEVNGELEGLEAFIKAITLRLEKGGRIAVITFHSLEDRIVKNAFKELEKDCICDKRMPICTCGKRKEIEILTKKPIVASDEERQINKRSESAKLRIAERI